MLLSLTLVLLSLPLPSAERQSQMTLGEREQFESVGRRTVALLSALPVVESSHVVRPETLGELRRLLQRVAGEVKVGEYVSWVGHRDHVPLLTAVGRLQGDSV